MAGYFDESYYLNIKVKQLAGSTDSNGNPWTAEAVKQAMNSMGYSPEQHYESFGRREQLSPNPYFNEVEYLETKLAALREDPATAAAWSGKGVTDLRQAISDAGMTPAEHYEKIGAFETRADGTLLNPSNAFDANAYFAAKLQQLIEKGELVNGKPAAEASVAEIVAAVKEAGLSPVSHYATCGSQEAGAQGVPLVQTVPSEQRVPNDPARSQITGENVPGNFNPPSLPPDAAKPGPVAKPADMGGLAPESVSPSVTLPTKPLPVPGDANYAKPPAGLVDTNEKPVVVVPDSSGGLHFGVLDPETGNIMGVDPGTGGVTGDIIGKDDGAGNITPDPDLKPDTGGGGGGNTGGGGGGGGGVVPDTPLNMDISDKAGMQNITLSNADDTLSGVKAEHLGSSGLTGGALDGKGGIDTINLTAGEYTITTSRMSSFENINIANTTEDFNWRLSSKDYAYGDNVAIKAEDLAGGDLRINTRLLDPSGSSSSGPVKFSVTTGTGDDDVLWSSAKWNATELTMNTGAGDDRLVIASGLAAVWATQTISDSVFNDISGSFDAQGHFQGYFSGGSIDLGAGANTLVVHGQANFSQTVLKSTSGSFAGAEFRNYGYGDGVTITMEQFTALTEDTAVIKVGGEVINVGTDDNPWYINSSSHNAIHFAVPSGAGQIPSVDLSQITVAAGSHCQLDLNGATTTGTLTLQTDNTNKVGQATWSYLMKSGNSYTGRSGLDEQFDSYNGMQGITVSGDSGDNDKLSVIQYGSIPVQETGIMVVGDNGSGGTVSGIKIFETLSATKPGSDPGVPSFLSSNIAFAQNTGIEKIIGGNGNDTIDVTNLALKTCDLGGGTNTLKGLTATHFSTVTSIKGGFEGTSSVELGAGAYAITAGELQQFKTITFKSTTDNVSWTLGATDYDGLNSPITVDVTASSLTTGMLTFDASLVQNAKFNVTGGGGADTFTGGKLGDTFDGGDGTDTFVYTDLTGSLLANHDTIVGFTSGEDKIKVESTQLSAITNVDGSGLVTANATALTAEALGTACASMVANGAAVVTVGATKYLVLNDNDAVFDAATDAVIAIGTSTIAASDFI